MIFFKEPGIQYVIQVRTRFGKKSEPYWTVPNLEDHPYKFAVYDAIEFMTPDLITAQKAYGQDNVRVLRIRAELVVLPNSSVAHMFGDKR